jgi:hypothetical protein
VIHRARAWRIPPPHRAPGTGHRPPGTGHRAPGTGKSIVPIAIRAFVWPVWAHGEFEVQHEPIAFHVKQDSHATPGDSASRSARWRRDYRPELNCRLGISSPAQAEIRDQGREPLESPICAAACTRPNDRRTQRQRSHHDARTAATRVKPSWMRWWSVSWASSRRGSLADQAPTVPSMPSRRKSAWPLWRAYSWIKCMMTNRRETCSFQRG